MKTTFLTINIKNDVNDWFLYGIQDWAEMSNEPLL